jgi:hypothetical protein
LRLDARVRSALYAIFAALFVTGVGWLLADQMKETASGERWQSAGTYLLMLHGGTAMVALMLLGALVPLHVQQAWRSRRNRVTGMAMVAFNSVLVATSFGLYYAGSDTLRPRISDLHIGVGLFPPCSNCHPRLRRPPQLLRLLRHAGR